MEAGTKLHGFAADMVPPFKKALDTREPTCVTIALELMQSILRTDPEVGKGTGVLAAVPWVHSCGGSMHAAWATRPRAAPAMAKEARTATQGDRLHCWLLEQCRPGDISAGLQGAVGCTVLLAMQRTCSNCTAELDVSLMIMLVQVGKVWIYYLRDFAQTFNLFLSRNFLINMGYNQHRLNSTQRAVNEVLLMMQQFGGEHAKVFMRKWVRQDPMVTDESFQVQQAKAESKVGHQPWTPYLLI